MYAIYAVASVPAERLLLPGLWPANIPLFDSLQRRDAAVMVVTRPEPSDG